ncbi:hypothetical protein ACIOYV_08150 [Pseudomonas sp. NPDC087342]|uniref:hypothetical protein n=1 Tax=Pseudomonas sp. NPDC087342 TaxID=3364437 RepID=UPI00380859F2
MTRYKKVVDNDPGRAALRAIRSSRSVTAFSPPELQGLLSNVDGDEPNKLPLELTNVDNEVLITDLPDTSTGRAISFQLLWGGALVGDLVETVTPVTLPVSLTLPAAETFTQKRSNLSYRMIYGGNQTDWYPPIPIYIDKEPPDRGLPSPSAILPPAIVDGRVTAEYVQANNGLKIQIPIPTDTKTGDVVEVFYGDSDPAKNIGRYTVKVPVDRDPEIFVTLIYPEFVLAGEGAKIIYYVWRDRVGNIGPHSYETKVKSIHRAEPSNLMAPQVPVADPVIDVKDAFPTTTVVIPLYDDHQATDTIVVTWGTREQSPKQVGNNDPVFVEVPYSEVSFGGPGPINGLPVTYSVWRSGLEYPEGTGITVNVDLRSPGTPPPPDPTDPEVGNPNLKPVNVYGAVTTTPVNTLLPDDAGQPATAKVEIDVIRNAGDLYTLFWNGIPVSGPDGTFLDDLSEPDDYEIEFVIPWDDVEDAGNNSELPVHYEITNPAFPSNPNPSLRQKVNVYVLPVNLPPPVINYTVTIQGTEFLNCSSLRTIPNVGRAAVVSVNGGGPLQRDMVLTFEWTGNTYDSSGSPMPVTPYEFTKTLIGNEHLEGFIVYIPLLILERIRDGSGSIKYTVEVNGRDEPSDSHDVEVVVRDGAGNSCPIT